MADNLKDLPERQCSVCGVNFLPKKGGYNAKYCGETCRNKRARSRFVCEGDAEKVSNCVVCNAEFPVSKFTSGDAKYCSWPCSVKSRSARDRKLRPEVLSRRRRSAYVRVKGDERRYEAHKARARSSAQLARDWLKNYKMERGCADCGFKGHFAALELDHEGEKSVEISIARSSIARLKKEIEDGKCVVRCANCHAKKTWQRKMEAKGLTDEDIAKIEKSYSGRVEDTELDARELEAGCDDLQGTGERISAPLVDFTKEQTV